MIRIILLKIKKNKAFLIWIIIFWGNTSGCFQLCIQGWVGRQLWNGPRKMQLLAKVGRKIEENMACAKFEPTTSRTATSKGLRKIYSFKITNSIKKIQKKSNHLILFLIPLIRCHLHTSQDIILLWQEFNHHLQFTVNKPNSIHEMHDLSIVINDI